jgi:hypothetical protein
VLRFESLTTSKEYGLSGSPLQSEANLLVVAERRTYNAGR